LKRHVRPALIALGLASAGSTATAQIAVTSSAVMQRAAARGERYEGTLTIRNSSDAPQPARVVQTDYAFTADGRTTFGAAGTSPRSNARWIRFDPAELVVPPRATASVRYTVTVPDGADLSGTYWSLLIVEQTSAAPPAAGGRAGGDVGLTVATRHATQIATHVGTRGAARVEVDSVQATSLVGGRRALRFDFFNVGDRSAAVTLKADVYDGAGTLVSRQTKVRGVLYPGSSGRQTFDVGPITPGSYRVIITADAGGDELFGGTFRVRF
jgi:hypothetical protein